MAKRRELTRDQCVAICALRKSGLTLQTIADQIGCSISVVHYSLHRNGETGSFEKRPKIRESLLSEHDKRVLKISALRNRRKTSFDHTREVNLVREPEIQVSRETVRKALCNVGLKGYVAAHKPSLRKPNKRARYRFALGHRHWTNLDWNDVFWTDETRYELFNDGHRVYVRRMPTEKYLPECLVPTLKGAASVTLWGGMCANGTSAIQWIDKIMNKEIYHDILIKGIENATELFNGKFI